MDERPFSFDLFGSELAGRLHETRTIILSGRIDEPTVARVTAQLTTLAAASEEAPINVVVSASEGSLESGLALYDAVRYAESRVRMLATDRVGSAGLLVLVAVPVTDRYALSHARFLLQHPPDEAREGSDILDRAEEAARLRERVHELLARQTGQPPKQVEADMRRGRGLIAEEAVAYGLVRRVVERPSDVF